MTPFWLGVAGVAVWLLINAVYVALRAWRSVDRDDSYDPYA